VQRTRHPPAQGTPEPSLQQPRRPASILAVAGAVAGVLFVALVASTPDSPFHPLLPESSGAGPLGLAARALGLDGLSRDALAGVGIAAMLVAVATFLFALRAAWRGAIPLGLAIGLGVALHALAFALPLLFSRDVYSYAMYGRIFSLHGANPYLAVPSDFPADPMLPLVGEQWLETPAVYGPAFTLLSAGLTRLIRDPIGLIVAFKAIAVAASLGTMVLVAVLARKVRPERAAFAVLLVSWNPVVLFQAVGGGHNDVLLGLALVGALALLIAGWPLLAAVALALGALVKAPALVPLILLIAMVVARQPAGRRLRVAGLYCAVVGGLFLITAAPFLQVHDPTLGQLELAGHQGWLAPSRLFARVGGWLGEVVGGNVGRSVGEVVLRVVFPLVLVVTLIAIGLHLVRRARSDPEATDLTPPAVGASWGWALLLFTLCAPILLPWYVAWTLPLAWLLPRTPRLVAVGTAVGLAVSEMVAEPLRSPLIFEDMVLALHYVITPVVFLGLVWLLVDLRRRLRLGVPLEAEEGEVAAGRREDADGEGTGEATQP
jgi:Glycosyltransferase family 87